MTPPPKPRTAALDPDAELQLVVRQAGNDSATLVKSLEAYLVKYPDSPRRRGDLPRSSGIGNESSQ